MATGDHTGAGDAEHFIGAQVGALPLRRRLGEGAVVADIAAEARERNKNFWRVADAGRMRAVS